PLGKWIHLAPFPEALEEVGGAAANGKLYVFGGLIPIWKPAGVVYEYDPSANAWTKRAPMPHPLHHPAIAELGGKVYLFGGFVLPDSGPPGWVPINDAWEYDPAADGPQPHGGGDGEWEDLCDRRTPDGSLQHRHAGEHRRGPGIRPGGERLGDPSPDADRAQRGRHGGARRPPLRGRRRTADVPVP